MIVRPLRIGPMHNLCYIVGDEASREGAVVDPAGDAERILDEIRKLGLRISYVLNTHGHDDHTGANEDVARASGAKVAAHPLCKARHDISLEDGSELTLGELPLRALHTPGHTPDSICILAGGNALFTGDTLFVGECGRTDLTGSSPEALWRSLFVTLAALPDDVMVLPGHDYGSRPFSTLGEERRTNYTLKPRTVEEFVRFMAE